MLILACSEISILRELIRSGIKSLGRILWPKKTEKMLFNSSRRLMQYVLRVTGLSGLPGLPGRVTLSAGVTIRHVNVSGWGNPPSRGRGSWQKAQKRNIYVLKLCTFPSRLMAEITRNRNGHTRSVKCSHFGIFRVVNRPYFKLFLIKY